MSALSAKISTPIFALFWMNIALVSSPCEAMERSYSAPENHLAQRMAVVAIPVAAAFARALTQWFPESREDLTTRTPANRGVFLVTNEIANEETLEAARSLPRRGNVGIGVSAFFNLELFLARAGAGVTRWIMIDPAPEVQSFWHEFLQIMSESRDLDTVFAQLESVLSQHSNRFFTPDFLTVNGIVAPNEFRSWLKSNLEQAKLRLMAAMVTMDFVELKKLLTEGIILFPTDLAATSDVEHLETYLTLHHFEIDMLYVSNVYMHLPKRATEAFRIQIDCLRRVSNGDAPAYLVEALPKREGELARISGSPIQKIYDH